MWAGDLGRFVANELGVISIYIDDTGTNDGDDRTWYDGLRFESENFQFFG